MLISLASSGKLWMAVGAIFGLLSILAGAFGAHALRGALTENALNTFETAVRFQMYHALAILVTGLLTSRLPSNLIGISGALFTIGTLVFSGSLYALSLSGIGAFGAVAPIGGISLIGGWTALIVGIIKRKPSERS